MTEDIIITLIVCSTVLLCVFFLCMFITSDGDSNFETWSRHRRDEKIKKHQTELERDKIHLELNKLMCKTPPQVEPNSEESDSKGDYSYY